MIKNWERALITQDSTIESAIRVIEEASVRAAIVVDEKKKLLGMVTDGDIRRGLLKNIKLGEPVSKVMNFQPKIASEGASKEQILSLLEESKCIQIPLVNSEGVVIGIETLEHITLQKKIDNVVFLMVGGFGKRLWPLTENSPKPLLKVGQYPVLQNILESFIADGFHRFVFAVHYKAQMIKEYFGAGEKWGVTIDYIEEEKPLGTAGALGYLKKETLPVILMNGDLLTKVSFATMLDFHLENEAVATIGVREYDFQLPYGLVKFEGVQVTDLVEKPLYNFFVNAGFYVLSPAAVFQIKPGVYLDTPDLLKSLVAQEKKVVMFPVHEYWLDIGRFDDFERAQQDFVTHF